MWGTCPSPPSAPCSRPPRVTRSEVSAATDVRTEALPRVATCRYPAPTSLPIAPDGLRKCVSPDTKVRKSGYSISYEAHKCAGRCVIRFFKSIFESLDLRTFVRGVKLRAQFRGEKRAGRARRSRWGLGGQPLRRRQRRAAWAGSRLRTDAARRGWPSRGGRASAKVEAPRASCPATANFLAF